MRQCLSCYPGSASGNRDLNPDVLDRLFKIDIVCCDFWFPIYFFLKKYDFNFMGYWGQAA